MGDSNTNFMDGMFSHMTSVSPAHSDSLHLNNQNQTMAEFPSLGHSHPLSDTEVEERFMGGAPISAASLATLLAARCAPELATSAPSVNPLQMLNSAFATSVNCGYDGILGDMNINKWDFDKFLACPELAGKVPGRMGFQSFQFMDPNGWISSDNANASSDLSLSLAMCQPSIIHGTRVQDQSPEISCSGVSERHLGSETTCNNKNLALCFSSCRPVQLSHFLSGSRYLCVIQEILAEIASYSLENLAQMNYPASGRIGASCLADRGYAVMGSDGDDRFEFQTDLVLQGQEVEAMKKKLLALLQMVDERYNQCLDEIHTVISAFHAATELDPHVHARFALQTISSLYKNLRDRISNQILKMGAYLNKGDSTREEESSFETSFIQKQWALQQLRRKDHQLWRPQRGLPERSVSVLRAWMFQNFLHPYPKDTEKHLLAARSGLTRSQVSNWFINARVRLWKPMIEEMYAEMNRRKGRRNDEETDSNHRSMDCGRFNVN